MPGQGAIAVGEGDKESGSREVIGVGEASAVSAKLNGRMMLRRYILETLFRQKDHGSLKSGRRAKGVFMMLMMVCRSGVRGKLGS